jgi:hypothetical protein
MTQSSAYVQREDAGWNVWVEDAQGNPVYGPALETTSPHRLLSDLGYEMMSEFKPVPHSGGVYEARLIGAGLPIG